MFPHCHERPHSIRGVACGRFATLLACQITMSELAGARGLGDGGGAGVPC